MTSIDALSAETFYDRLRPTTAAQLDALVPRYLGSVFPALSLTVIHRGNVLLNQAWGWIDPDTMQFPVTPASRFDLASVTKLFTASTFLALVSEGKVKLDTPLVDIIPEFGENTPRGIDGGQDPHTKVMLPTDSAFAGKSVDPARVTFRHLLLHTSGLAPWRAVYLAAGAVPAPPNEPESLPAETRWKAGIRFICQTPFVGEPGDTVRYSDLGLILLSEAIIRLDGRPLDAAIAARVTAPLNLTTTLFNPVRAGIDRSNIPPTEDDPAWRGRRAWGEVHDENACGLGGVSGHAGLFSTARDVAAFGQAWLERDSRLGITQPLMDEAVREHAQTDGMRRGLGWSLKAVEDSSCGDLFSLSSYGHTGFTGTSLWIDPERQLVVATLTNRVYPGRDKPGIHEFRRAVHTLFAEATDLA